LYVCKSSEFLDFGLPSCDLYILVLYTQHILIIASMKLQRSSRNLFEYLIQIDFTYGNSKGIDIFDYISICMCACPHSVVM
jgi:hypothetical protein